jgi:hypothetical protein
MRALLTGIVVFGSGFAALQIAYPWNVYYGNFKFGWWYTMASYVLLAGILGVIAGSTAIVLPTKPSVHRAARGIAGGVATLVLTSLLAILFGVAGFHVPGTRIQGIFFSEWQFIRFIFCVAFPVSGIVAILCAAGSREPGASR